VTAVRIQPLRFLAATAAILLLSALAVGAPSPILLDDDPLEAADATMLHKAQVAPLSLGTTGATITNGTVTLGIYREGHLGSGGTSLLSNGYDGLHQGCICEGWGIADLLSGVQGWASGDTKSGGMGGLTVESFSATGDTATSIVRVGSTFRVTTDWTPSDSPQLYKAVITVENISAQPVEAVYRRVMDWDIQPLWNHYLTIQGTAGLRHSRRVNEGVASVQPLPRPAAETTVALTEFGGKNSGALFDVNVGTLAPGQIATFSLFYGGAPDQATALTAVATVGAPVYAYSHSMILADTRHFIFGLTEPIVRTKTCTPGLTWEAPLSSLTPATVPAGSNLHVAFTWGGNNCALDDSITVVIRHADNPRIRYVAHVLHHQIQFDPLTGPYSFDFTPAAYGVGGGTPLRIDVYQDGTRIGWSRVDVTP
jgi:hypothetical protein